MGHLAADVRPQRRHPRVRAVGLVCLRLRHEAREYERGRDEAGHLHRDHHPCSVSLTYRLRDHEVLLTRGGGALVRGEPGGAEHGEGGLDHDAGPAVEGAAHEARHPQHGARHGHAPHSCAESEGPRPRPDHRVPQPHQLQDGVGEGGRKHAH